MADGRWRRVARHARPGRLAEGATLGVLCWIASTQLGLFRLVNLAGTVGLVVCTALVAAVAWAVPRGARALAAAVALGYAVVAGTPLVRMLIPQTVRRDPIPARPAVDAVAVLSNAVGADGIIRGQGLERLVAGAAWARALDRPLVISIVRVPGSADAVSSAADQRQIAALAGVARVYAIDSVAVTRDEAVREAALARREGWRRLLVVTSPYHSRRACAAYERAGVAVLCAPGPSRDYALGGPHPLAGPGERVAAFRDWLYETVGWAVYRARGWV